MSKGQGKLLTKKLIMVHKLSTNQGMHFKELTLVGQKLSFNCISFYLFIAILYAKMSRVNKVLRNTNCYDNIPNIVSFDPWRAQMKNKTKIFFHLSTLPID